MHDYLLPMPKWPIELKKIGKKYRKKKYLEVLSELEKLSEKNIDSNFFIGRIYFVGKVTPQNYHNAGVYFYKADSIRCNVLSYNKYYLGLINLISGQNYEKIAFNSFLMSAKYGNPYGMLELGRLYKEGYGTEKDLIKAHVNFNLAMIHFTDYREKREAKREMKKVEEISDINDIYKAQEDAAKRWNGEKV